MLRYVFGRNLKTNQGSLYNIGMCRLSYSRLRSHIMVGFKHQNSYSNDNSSEVSVLGSFVCHTLGLGLES